MNVHLIYITLWLFGEIRASESGFNDIKILGPFSNRVCRVPVEINRQFDILHLLRNKTSFEAVTEKRLLNADKYPTFLQFSPLGGNWGKLRPCVSEETTTSCNTTVPSSVKTEMTTTKKCMVCQSHKTTSTCCPNCSKGTSSTATPCKCSKCSTTCRTKTSTKGTKSACTTTMTSTATTTTTTETPCPSLSFTEPSNPPADQATPLNITDEVEPESAGSSTMILDFGCASSGDSGVESPGSTEDNAHTTASKDGDFEANIVDGNSTSPTSVSEKPIEESLETVETEIRDISHLGRVRGQLTLPVSLGPALMWINIPVLLPGPLPINAQNETENGTITFEQSIENSRIFRGCGGRSPLSLKLESAPGPEAVDRPVVDLGHFRLGPRLVRLARPLRLVIPFPKTSHLPSG